ncbi:MAG: HAMP domain-containing histidine kinase [Burkholderiaceae bacterium]|nr:HAMP domain-containing histidine kinase [Burkholderiaceae bacterium]
MSARVGWGKRGPSTATRLAVGYALLVGVSILIASAVFYFGTVGVMDQRIDAKIRAISGRLTRVSQDRSIAGVAKEIEFYLHDGIDSDTETFLLVSPDGRAIVGNLTEVPHDQPQLDAVATREVVRSGKRTASRIIASRFADGSLLYVGYDLTEHERIRSLVVRALLSGVATSLLMLAAGALLFRRQIEGRIAEIRRTALRIEAGDLSQRIPVVSSDEFGRLAVDINRMLDRIGQLMDGVRHVSNAIAHDLRTPLGRIRGKLESALHQRNSAPTVADAAEVAIEDIDELTHLFDKLLQIAEAESGMRAKTFELIDLNGIAHDMVELYDATAEENRIQLKLDGDGAAVPARVDRNLIASAVASLIDNAIKYAGPGTTVEVGAQASAHSVTLAVRDNGPGIPAEERPRVIQRFYRLDHSRNIPGNGLGLSIVSAIATLHGGSLQLQDAEPGLLARIVLPVKLS